MNTAPLKKKIYEVKDYPKPGVGFKDITPLVADAKAYKEVIDALSAWARFKKPDLIVGIESRGYLFAAPVARDLKRGLAVIRKKGKLPRKTVCVQAPNEYAVEYFEMHEDAIQPGQRVLVIDDLIATGSSSIAAINLVKILKGVVVGFGAAIELQFLNGLKAIRQAHPDVAVFSLIKYKK
ncbi:MAG: adenine phosphoribosyltransferase [Candidatus Aminicenantes bacterium]|nr:adenine phosphoribosyltransferase [Candidatus Aminicenantes bacterium]